MFDKIASYAQKNSSPTGLIEFPVVTKKPNHNALRFFPLLYAILISFLLCLFLPSPFFLEFHLNSLPPTSLGGAMHSRLSVAEPATPMAIVACTSEAQPTP